MPDAIALVEEKSSAIVELDGHIDGLSAETFNLESRTGNSPLESGASVTDHVLALPDTIEVKAHVRGIDRANRAFAELKRLQNSISIVTVVSPMATRRELVVTSASADRRGNGLHIAIKLEQILRVSLDGSVPLLAPPAGSPASDRTNDVVRGRIDSIPDTTLDDDLAEIGDEIDAILEGLDSEQDLSFLDDLDDLAPAPTLLQRTVSAFGNPNSILRSTLSAATAFRQGGTASALRSLAGNTAFPTPLRQTLSGLSPIVRVFDSGRTRSRNTLLSALADGLGNAASMTGPLGIASAMPGPNGQALSTVFQTAGAFGYRNETDIAQAALVLSRRSQTQPPTPEPPSP